MCDNKEQCVVTKNTLLPRVILTTSLRLLSLFSPSSSQLCFWLHVFVTHFHLLPSCSSSSPCVKSFPMAVSPPSVRTCWRLWLYSIINLPSFSPLLASNLESPQIKNIPGTLQVYRKCGNWGVCVCVCKREAGGRILYISGIKSLHSLSWKEDK